MSNNRVSYEEQQAMGLVRRNTKFVQPERQLPVVQGEVLPPVRSVPTIVDPYASAMPQTVQMVTKFEATPITRAQAMTMKVNQVTIFLAILTGALMYVMQWYPLTWGYLAIFTLWLALASIEWIAVFCLLAILDYKETPAAQNRMQMRAYINMMQTEQYHRIRAMYPEQFKDK